jgi:uncharacterized protein YqjF (DUF2071 family)
MRPLLKADWRNLLLLNFAVPTEVVAWLAPPGTEPDLYCGRSYVSIVGFQFQRIRLFGLAVPFHTNFPEVNLRFYVRRRVGHELRRGVVFVREIAPRRAVAFVANRIYNESYTTCRMRSSIQSSNGHIGPGESVEYAWRSPIPCHCTEARAGGSSDVNHCDHWNQLSARVAASFAPPLAGSLEEFIIEHYWGYTRCRSGHTSEFRVAHEPWLIAPAADVTWNCQVSSNYDSPLAEFLAAPPVSAIIAAGSPVQVFRGRRI